jgi:hypothetical protein
MTQRYENSIQSTEKYLRVIESVNYRVSCRSIFGELKILLPHYISLRSYASYKE